MGFTPGRRPSPEQDLPSAWFVMDQGQVLVRMHEGVASFLTSEDLAILGLDKAMSHYVGATDSVACWLTHGEIVGPVPEGYEWAPLRSLFGVVDEDFFWMAGRAHHLAVWDRNHRYCGACKADLVLKEDEWAKQCESCGQILYPQISPAIIVSVVDRDRILLARGSRYRYPFFTVLAGFVEPGEDLESAVRREVREEVGLSVKNIRYFGSQPWPFPNSLMIGFTAEYADGEIDPDPNEILEARWFTRDAMPEIPASISISRRLIEAFTGEK